MIRLYDYWRSSASYRVRIALGLASLDWEGISINLQEGDQQRGPYLALNPQGLVPMIEIDGKCLTQSLAIIEYLNEIHSLGLLPSDPWQRAHVRAIAYAIAIDIHPVCNLRVARHAVGRSDAGITMKNWMQAFIGPGLFAVEAMLKGDHYCFGDTLTLADICLVPQVYNARRWEVDMRDLPMIGRIVENLELIPAFAAARPEKFRGSVANLRD